MLNKVRIHAAKTGLLWFNAPDIAKILTIRTDGLLARKKVVARKFKTTGLLTNYINEASFRLLFKDNSDILVELDHYKLTGELSVSDKYSNLLTVAYFFVGVSLSSEMLELVGFSPLSKKAIRQNSHQPEVALALLQVYLNAFFNDTNLQSHEYALLGLLLQEFPTPLDTAFLKEMFFGKKPPEMFIKALCSAKIQDLTEFRQKLKKYFGKTEIATVADSVITRAKADVNSVFGVDTKQGKDKAPLLMHHFQYPRVLEALVRPDGSDTMWMGD